MFIRTALHPTKRDFDNLLLKFDETGQDALEELTMEQRKGDLYETMKSIVENASNRKIKKFWDEMHKIPAWVDWSQIARGQLVCLILNLPCIQESARIFAKIAHRSHSSIQTIRHMPLHRKS